MAGPWDGILAGISGGIDTYYRRQQMKIDKENADREFSRQVAKDIGDSEARAYQRRRESPGTPGTAGAVCGPPPPYRAGKRPVCWYCRYSGWESCAS